MSELVKFDLLSVDAWRDCDGGWNWNNWHTIERDIFIAESEISPRKIFAMLRKWNYLTPASKGKMAMQDDGHNIVIAMKSTGEPVLALEYGHYL